jgi:thymidylate synthase (FAD)
MEIIAQSHTVIDKLEEHDIYRKLEQAARTCYKSQESGSTEETKEFLRKLIKSGHESVLEHVNVTVRFITDRGVSHELVRHRIASYSQESTRYCNYSKKGCSFIVPYFYGQDSQIDVVWEFAMLSAELLYTQLIEKGCKPQAARAVLPNSLKTEIVVTANLREWRHITKLRTSKRTHPQMRNLMLGLLSEFKETLPIIFEDIEA